MRVMDRGLGSADAGERAGALAGCAVCDALNRLPADAHEPCCWRCASPLVAAQPAASDAMGARLSAVIALLCAAWVCLLAAHLFPLVALELQGQRNAVSLGSAVRALWNEGRVPLAAALAMTLVLAPLGEAAAMLVAVIGLRARDRRWHAHVGSEAPSRWLVSSLHVWQGLRHWNLTEVLILAAGVALVRLGQLATLVIGPALIALMAFMALRLAALRMLPPERAWPLVGLRTQ
jgi:paraquat-inducible protein A